MTPEAPRFTFGQRVILAVVPRIVWALIWVLGVTWRFEVIAEEGVTPILFDQKPGGKIYCIWHQCVLPSTIYFRRSDAVILISQSFDGELITRILKMFSFDAVRGSSSRGARGGLMGLKQTIEDNKPAIFMADGPRGPIYRTKMGPIKLAQMTGSPVGAFHTQPEHAWVLGSWDRFMIPKPFTRIVVSWAAATVVPENLAPEEFEPLRASLNDALERARHRAQEHFKKASVGQARG